VFLVFGPTAKMLSALVLTWAVIALTMIDFDTQLLPDDITLPLVWARAYCQHEWRMDSP
jgi:leader peptidase (prepilin peptidase)/N-methyltransferase